MLLSKALVVGLVIAGRGHAIKVDRYCEMRTSS